MHFFPQWSKSHQKKERRVEVVVEASCVVIHRRDGPVVAPHGLPEGSIAWPLWRPFFLAAAFKSVKCLLGGLVLMSLLVSSGCDLQKARRIAKEARRQRKQKRELTSLVQSFVKAKRPSKDLKQKILRAGAIAVPALEVALNRVAYKAKRERIMHLLVEFGTVAILA